MLARKRASGLIRIDDQRGRGKRRRRQVVVGDQHFDAACRGRGDAVVAGDAVVDGDDQPRRHRGGCVDDLRREPVAVLEPVRDEEIDDGAHRREPAHADGARGGAVGVVVGDDHDLLAAGDRVGEARGGGVDPLHRRERRQRREVGVELVRRAPRRARRRRARAPDARRRRPAPARRREPADGRFPSAVPARARRAMRRGRAACGGPAVRCQSPGRRACQTTASPPSSASSVTASSAPRGERVPRRRGPGSLERGDVDVPGGSATTIESAPAASSRAASRSPGTARAGERTCAASVAGDARGGERAYRSRRLGWRRQRPAAGKPDAVRRRTAPRARARR